MLQNKPSARSRKTHSQWARTKNVRLFFHCKNVRLFFIYYPSLEVNVWRGIKQSLPDSVADWIRLNYKLKLYSRISIILQAMESGDRQKVVLRAFWPFYRMLSTYNWANFQNVDQGTFRQNVIRTISFTSLLITMLVAWVGEISHCVIHSFNLSVIALQLALLINLTLITITYVAIGMKKRMVGEVMDRVQATVNQSMAYFLHLFKFFRRSFEQSGWFSGCFEQSGWFFENLFNFPFL